MTFYALVDIILNMNKDILIKTAAKLTNSPKGILAIDESIKTCDSRFEKLGIPTTEEKRREYRELLVTAHDVEKYISGYILFDETIRQSTTDGKSFTSILKSKGIDVGIKVDEGTQDYGSILGDKITEGLDGLLSRLDEYKKMGATFAKWRAIYNIGNNTPSKECMEANAESFAKYALLCQEHGIVPIVEPEILIDGDHSIEQCYEVTAKNLNIVFSALKSENVFIPGILLKTSMVIAGKSFEKQSTPEEVAEMTIRCLKEHVPADIGGIVFLSGGQEDEEATLNLNAMHKGEELPWPLTFSYGRAIQNPALKSWAKNPTDFATAQKLLVEAAKANNLANKGKYKK
jgi:fructose-bisphosphate aldolase class I